ncbi:unnamed protein product [Nezara viridula]|uniref:Uncharacterized protein n=1 Tax=Nezara viridula TaxID=85310 RepID=A0A9P0EA23_NEZVI|nr:unnamed protein product [Nezara viridula]
MLLSFQAAVTADHFTESDDDSEVDEGEMEAHRQYVDYIGDFNIFQGETRNLCLSVLHAGLFLIFGQLLRLIWSRGPIVAVQAVKRTAAHLPCDMSPPIPNDTVTLVVWYKNDVKPIYRAKPAEREVSTPHDVVVPGNHTVLFASSTTGIGSKVGVLSGIANSQRGLRRHL